MDLMEPWLTDFLLDEVRRVLEWRDARENIHTRSAEFEGRSFEDDGSSLKITPAKAGQVTQVLKFHNRGEPVRATLSDLRTRINVSLATKATKHYEEGHGRAIWDEGVGGILQLNDYRIMATTLGPKASQLLLLVNDFKFLGAKGSHRLGNMPRAIEDETQSKALLTKLTQQWKTRGSLTSKGTSTGQSTPITSSIHSPASGVRPSSNAPGQPEPLAFMSQLPPKHLSNAPSMLRSFSPTNDAEPSIHHSSLTSIGQTRTAKLGLPSDAEVIHFISKEASAHSSRGELEAAARNAPNRLEQHLIHKPTSVPDTNADIVRTSDAITSVRAKEKRAVSPSPLNPFLSEVVPETERKEEEDHGCTPNNAHFKSIANRPTQELSPAPSLGRASPAGVVLSKPRRSKKISMRDIKIPTEQETLLTRPDSWIPAEPGRRELVANLPLPVLKMLNARADRRAKRLQQSSKEQRLVQEHTAEDGGFEKHNDPESDDELPLTWDASPQAVAPTSSNGLPPDSSLPSPIDSGEYITHPQKIVLPPTGQQSPQVPRQHSPDSSDDDKSPRTVAKLNRNCSNSVEDMRGQAKSHQSYVALMEDVSSNPDDDAAALMEPKSSIGSTEKATRLGQDAQADRPTPMSKHISTPSSPPDSDLEVSIPPGMVQSRSQPPRDSHEEYVPSTAVEKESPLTQVKRTPYVKDHKINVHQRPSSHCASSIENSNSVISGTSIYSSGNPPNSGSTEMEILSAVSVNAAAPTIEQPAPQHHKHKYKDGEAFGGSYFSLANEEDPGQSNLKRKDSPPAESSESATKRPKIWDFLPSNMTQAEEELVNPGVMADQLRRDFFERRSSPSSADASNAVSPIKSYNDGDAFLRVTKMGEQSRPLHYGTLDDLQSPQSAGAKSPALAEPEHNADDLSPHEDGVLAPPASFMEDVDAKDVSVGAPNVEPAFAIDTASFTTKIDNKMVTVPPSQKQKPLEVQKVDGHTIGLSNNLDGVKDAIAAEHKAKPSTNGEDPSAMSPEPVPINQEQQALGTQQTEHDLIEPSQNPNSVENVLAVDHQPGLSANVVSANAKGFGGIDCEQDKPDHTPPSRELTPLHRTKVSLPHEVHQVSPPKLNDLNVIGRAASEHLNSQPEGQRETPKQPDTHVEALSAKNPYEQFVSAYPEYSGNVKHFSTLCTKISTLLKSGSVLPRSLWDDFIVRHKLEYPGYIQQCAEEGEDAVAYESYYATNVEEPKYTKRILSRADLPEPASFRDQRPKEVPEHVRAASPEIQVSSRLRISKKPGAQSARSKDEQPVTIDLTLDEAPEQIIEPKEKLVNRSLHNTPKSQCALLWALRDDGSNGESSHNDSGPQAAKNKSAVRKPNLALESRKGVRTSRSAIDDEYGTTLSAKRQPRPRQSGPPEIPEGQKTRRKGSSGPMRGTGNDLQPPDDGSKWYKDPHTPFNAFVRNYRNIRPANGNSFATLEHIKQGKKIQKQWLASRPKNNATEWIEID